MLTIKEKFHTLIEEVNNEQLLTNLYEILKIRNTNESTNLWDSLPLAEKNNILLALEESNNPETLISNDYMKINYRRWL